MKLIPVIHVVTDEQAMINAKLCADKGLDGVVLISHKGNVSQIVNLSKRVKTELNMWVCINLLGLQPIKAIMRVNESQADALWIDKLCTEEVAKALAEEAPDKKLFAGFLFKYQPVPPDLKAAAVQARLAYCAVTSGPGTGQAADKSEIEEVRELIGDHPVCIASGVSADNVQAYAGLADYLFVATSITGIGEMIIEEKLDALIAAVESCNSTNQ